MRLSATRLRATGGAIFRTAGGGGGFDADATAYIAAVEAADGQALEAGVKTAINTFVVGCKADGIWTALKASCILAGARTLSGALVPLAGTAPTNFNFVSGDYNRKTGLVGDGSTKYLNSNRSNNADPQNNTHLGVYVSTGDSASGYPYYAGGGSTGLDAILQEASSNTLYAYLDTSFGGITVASQGNTIGFKGASRSNSSQISVRTGLNTTNPSQNSSVETAALNITIFAGNYVSSVGDYSNSRLAFYSIGESLDLALLDTRVTTLIAAYDAAIVDPYYADVSLLLHGNGTNGSTTITDNSPSPKTVTAVGNAQISTAQNKFGGASIAFDGTGDYLSIPASSSFAFGLADFTVELWLYRSGSGQQHLYEGRDLVATNMILLYVNSSNQLAYYANNALAIATTAVPALNAWAHVALCRASGNSRLFLDGVQVGSTFADSTNIVAPPTTVNIGANPLGNTPLNGYIDDLRITKGVARYTANFTPPVSQFLDS